MDTSIIYGRASDRPTKMFNSNTCNRPTHMLATDDALLIKRLKEIKILAAGYLTDAKEVTRALKAGARCLMFNIYDHNECLYLSSAIHTEETELASGINSILRFSNDGALNDPIVLVLDISIDSPKMFSLVEDMFMIHMRERLLDTYYKTNNHSLFGNVFVNGFSPNVDNAQLISLLGKIVVLSTNRSRPNARLNYELSDLLDHTNIDMNIDDKDMLSRLQVWLHKAYIRSNSKCIRFVLRLAMKQSSHEMVHVCSIDLNRNMKFMCVDCLERFAHDRSFELSLSSLG